MEIVEHHKPDLLLSCSNWGTAMNLEEYHKMLKKVVVLAVVYIVIVAAVLFVYNVNAPKKLPFD